MRYNIDNFIINKLKVFHYKFLNPNSINHLDNIESISSTLYFNNQKEKLNYNMSLIARIYINKI